MPLESYNQILSAVCAGQNYTGIWMKQFQSSGSAVAGRWYDFFRSTGYPTAGNYTGSAGVATALNSNSTGATWIGDDSVTPDTKRLQGLRAWTSGTNATGWLWLVDYLLYYPSCVVSTGSGTTLDNTVTLPRYTDGVGVEAMVVVQTALGAASPALTFTYTNSTPTGSRTSLAQTALANSLPTNTLVGGTPFIRKQAGDVGIRSIDSYSITSGTTGTVAIVLYKPIVPIPIGIINTLYERDTISGIVSFPEIKDGACLGFIGQATGAFAANTYWNSIMDVVWD